MPEVPYKEIRERMYGRNNPLPYASCVEQLNKLNDRKELLTPMDKLKCISKISDLIKKEINSFWQGVKVNESKLRLDGEQIIMIYIYVASKAVVRDIYAHIKFCQSFSTPFLHNTKHWYCLTTLDGAYSTLTNEPDIFD